MADLDHLPQPAPKPEFNHDELMWIANAAGLRTGTSNIRPKGTPGLSAVGLLGMQDKLRALLPELNEVEEE